MTTKTTKCHCVILCGLLPLPTLSPAHIAVDTLNVRSTIITIEKRVLWCLIDFERHLVAMSLRNDEIIRVENVEGIFLQLRYQSLSLPCAHVNISERHKFRIC